MFNKTLFILAFFNLSSFFTTSTSLSQAVADENYVETESVVNRFESSIVELSPYDSHFRAISEREGNDWRLLCAMAYHESRFQSDVVSRCGARGIMQVMPRVASQFDVSAEQLSNVEDNIWVANRLLTLIESMMALPESVSQEDRTKLTLAAYNCGVGRIADARRLARSYGEDGTKWEVVASYLEKMNSAEYYEQEVVKYGRFTGAKETLAYVKNVINHYEGYCLLAMR